MARALSIGDCDLDGTTRRALVLTRAGAWVELRQFPEAEADLQSVVEEAEAEGDLQGLARARSVRAEIARLTGRYEDARAELGDGRGPAGAARRRAASWPACSGRGA